jgi:hypothetical protein
VSDLCIDIKVGHKCHQSNSITYILQMQVKIDGINGILDA